MGLAQQYRQPAPKPSAGERLIEAAKEMRETAKKGARRGPKPVDDPKKVVTLRVEASVIEKLPEDWRARAAEFLRDLAS